MAHSDTVDCKDLHRLLTFRIRFWFISDDLRHHLGETLGSLGMILTSLYAIWGPLEYPNEIFGIPTQEQYLGQ